MREDEGWGREHCVDCETDRGGEGVCVCVCLSGVVGLEVGGGGYWAVKRVSEWRG